MLQRQDAVQNSGMRDPCQAGRRATAQRLVKRPKKTILKTELSAGDGRFPRPLAAREEESPDPTGQEVRLKSRMPRSRHRGKESATENRPPRAVSRSGVRVKRWCKRPPLKERSARPGKPLPGQDQIGSNDVVRIASRRLAADRASGFGRIDEWSSPRICPGRRAGAGSQPQSHRPGQVRGYRIRLTPAGNSLFETRYRDSETRGTVTARIAAGRCGPAAVHQSSRMSVRCLPAR